MKDANGRYDTRKATLVHTRSNHLAKSTGRNRTKKLYRSATGLWFIHHSGGPMTDMARRDERDNVTGSQHIEPVDVRCALSFLLADGREDAVSKYFPGYLAEATR